MKKNLKFTAAFFSILFSLQSVFPQGASSASDFFESGVNAQNRNLWFEAGESFLQAVQLNPSYGEAWFHLAQVTYEIEDFSLCLLYLENAEKFYRNRRDILNLKGFCLISLGRLSEAEEVFKSVVEEYPNDVESRFGLAELSLFNGSYNSAENFYLDALKRQGHNKKALLSLAVLSFETGKISAAEKYIQQALRYHASDPQVHYLASYFEIERGNLRAAEQRARSAIQIAPGYESAYILLGTILYAQKKYDDVTDICDYLISKDRNEISAWYLKGLCFYRKNDFDNAFETWNTAVSINENDEILRAALELLVLENLSLEDSRRNSFAQYHVKKARDFAGRFSEAEARYEYQRALQLDPNFHEARLEFAEILNKLGLNELYLRQLLFVQENKSSDTENTENSSGTLNQIRLSDTIESYSALMRYSLAEKWNVEPFYLDKTRWNIGLYYEKSPVQLLHPDFEEIASRMISNSFLGISSTAVSVEEKPVSNYGEAFRSSRRAGHDYFVIMKFSESEREVALDATVYNGRNGTKVKDISLFRTGNDKFNSLLRSFRRSILEILPVRGKIIARNGNTVLVDLGKTEGIEENTVFDIIKPGKIRTNDVGAGVTFDEKDYLGKITVTRTGEEISEGTLEQQNFYDLVNIGDEVLIYSVPSAGGEGTEGSVTRLETNPASDRNGNRLETDENQREENYLTAQSLGLVRSPSFIELIRNID